MLHHQFVGGIQLGVPVTKGPGDFPTNFFLFFLFFFLFLVLLIFTDLHLLPRQPGCSLDTQQPSFSSPDCPEDHDGSDHSHDRVCS